MITPGEPGHDLDENSSGKVANADPNTPGATEANRIGEEGVGALADAGPKVVPAALEKPVGDKGPEATATEPAGTKPQQCRRDTSRMVPPSTSCTGCQLGDIAQY